MSRSASTDAMIAARRASAADKERAVRQALDDLIRSRAPITIAAVAARAYPVEFREDVVRVARNRPEDVADRATDAGRMLRIVRSGLRTAEQNWASRIASRPT